MVLSKKRVVEDGYSKPTEAHDQKEEHMSRGFTIPRLNGTVLYIIEGRGNADQVKGHSYFKVEGNFDHQGWSNEDWRARIRDAVLGVLLGGATRVEIGVDVQDLPSKLRSVYEPVDVAALAKESMGASEFEAFLRDRPEPLKVGDPLTENEQVRFDLAVNEFQTFGTVERLALEALMKIDDELEKGVENLSNSQKRDIASFISGVASGIFVDEAKPDTPPLSTPGLPGEDRESLLPNG